MKWTEKYRVSAQDVDLNRVASASAIMRFMQDTANYHMEGVGPSYDELFDSGRAFMISRFAMVCHAALYSHDEITVETWAAPSRAASFNRCYRILRGDEVIAEATSVWALVDTSSESLIRVEQSGIDYGEEEALTISEPMRFRIPTDLPSIELVPHTVTYADVDVNRHINNTKYPDILCSYLDMIGRRVKSLAISYAGQAPLGAELSAMLVSDGDVHYFRTTRPDGAINVEAKIEVTNI